MRTETVILAAFVLEHDHTMYRSDTEYLLTQRLHGLLRMEDPDSAIISWWIAEDERYDGSVNDSAVFVTPGNQRVATRLLAQEGYTPDNNIVVHRRPIWLPSQHGAELNYVGRHRR